MTDNEIREAIDTQIRHEGVGILTQLATRYLELGGLVNEKICEEPYDTYAKEKGYNLGRQDAILAMMKIIGTKLSIEDIKFIINQNVINGTVRSHDEATVCISKLAQAIYKEKKWHDLHGSV